MPLEAADGHSHPSSRKARSSRDDHNCYQDMVALLRPTMDSTTGLANWPEHHCIPVGKQGIWASALMAQRGAVVQVS